MQREYRHLQSRLFFTLYFIPLIPLWKLGEYIECGSCGGTYGTEVLSLRLEDWQQARLSQDDAPLRLDHDGNDINAPQGPQAELVSNVRRCLVLFIASLGTATPAIMAAFRAAFKELIFVEVSDQQLLQDYQQAKNAGATVESFVPRVLGNQSNDVKQVVMLAAARIAFAEPGAQAAHQRALWEFGNALKLDTAAIQSIIEGRGQ